MAELTDAERVFLEALRTVRASLMDTITGLDDTIAEVEQAAAARPKPVDRLVPVDRCPTCGSTYRAQRRPADSGTLMTSIGCMDEWHPPEGFGPY